jgi:tRNA (Thr-GGU) A37 N-methylase
MSETYEVRPIGWVESSLFDRASAPKQGHDGAPDAWVVFDAAVEAGLRDIAVGTEVLLLTWFDRSHGASGRP